MKIYFRKFVIVDVIIYIRILTGVFHYGIIPTPFFNINTFLLGNRKV